MGGPADLREFQRLRALAGIPPRDQLEEDPVVSHTVEAVLRSLQHHYVSNTLDSNDDGIVSAADALAVINVLDEESFLGDDGLLPPTRLPRPITKLSRVRPGGKG